MDVAVTDPGSESPIAELLAVFRWVVVGQSEKEVPWGFDVRLDPLKPSRNRVLQWEFRINNQRKRGRVADRVHRGISHLGLHEWPACYPRVKWLLVGIPHSLNCLCVVLVGTGLN